MDGLLLKLDPQIGNPKKLMIWGYPGSSHQHQVANHFPPLPYPAESCEQHGQADKFLLYEWFPYQLMLPLRIIFGFLHQRRDFPMYLFQAVSIPG